MSTQLPLPAQWARLESRRDPAERLDRLRFDAKEAKTQIRVLLDGLAERHGIVPKAVTDVMEGYADDMLSDLIFDTERALERELEGGN